MNADQPILPSDQYWESIVATRLGVSRTRLRSLRKCNLTRDVDWSIVGNSVVITAGGIAKLERVLSASNPQVADTPKEGEMQAAAGTGGPCAALPSGPPPARKFMVWRIPPHRIDNRQRHVLICREVSGDQVQVSPWGLARVAGVGAERPVRVRDNANFVPGMVLEALNIGHGCWQYVGRMPRRQGKW